MTPQNRTALIIDDDPDVAELLALALEQRGFRVLRALTRDEAVPCLNHNPHVIVMDCMMPGMGPEQFANIARSRQPKIPIILATAAADREQKALRISATRLFKKPFDPIELLDAVEQLSLK